VTISLLSQLPMLPIKNCSIQDDFIIKDKVWCKLPSVWTCFWSDVNVQNFLSFQPNLLQRAAVIYAELHVFVNTIVKSIKTFRFFQSETLIYFIIYISFNQKSDWTLFLRVSVNIVVNWPSILHNESNQINVPRRTANT
jgi:hypothetical protein